MVGRVADHLAASRGSHPLRVAVDGGTEAADELFRERYHAACERYLREASPADRATALIDVHDPAAPELRRIAGAAGGSAPLFSYGTLQFPDVQRTTFGRLLEGRAARVVGHRLEWLTITDPYVIATSGTDRHPVVHPTGDPADQVEGTVLTVTAEELAAADLYEVDEYRRRRVDLAGGGQAWMYLAS